MVKFASLFDGTVPFFCLSRNVDFDFWCIVDENVVVGSSAGAADKQTISDYGNDELNFCSD